MIPITCLSVRWWVSWWGLVSWCWWRLHSSSWPPPAYCAASANPAGPKTRRRGRRTWASQTPPHRNGSLRHQPSVGRRCLPHQARGNHKSGVGEGGKNYEAETVGFVFMTGQTETVSSANGHSSWSCRGNMNPREVNIGVSGMPYSDAQQPGPRRPRVWGISSRGLFFLTSPTQKCNATFMCQIS